MGSCAGLDDDGPNEFININNGQRDRDCTLTEWERHWDRSWTTVFGLRNDAV